VSARPPKSLFIALTFLLAVLAGCSILDPDPPNLAPVIDSLNAVPTTVESDSSAVVTVQAHDPEGVALDYRWTATAGYFTAGSYEASATWRAPSYTRLCTLTVTVDDGRDETTGSLVVNVLAPPVPHLNVTAPEQHFGLFGDRLPVQLENDGSAEAVWTAEFGAAWATPAPAAGTLAPAAIDTVWLEVDRTVPSPGPHVADLTVQAVGDDIHTFYFDLVQPWTYNVIAQYPHDTTAFTQGLVWHDGWLYEGTGLYNGHSNLRRVDLETGQVLQQVDLGGSYFGEGITIWQDRIIQLTWQEHTAFVWALDDFAPLGTFAYPTQGWGLTHDDTRLIMSDGSAQLYFRDPDTFAETGRVTVTAFGEELRYLNELEWIDGAVWANVWQSNLVVRIDPNNGVVTDIVDLAGLLTPTEDGLADVLNGIAHDPATGRVFVTGKLWPWLFEIEIVDPSGG